MNLNIFQKLYTMNNKLDTMNNKLDTMNNKLDTMNNKLDTTNEKLGQIINITKLHRAELSEYSLFMLFKDDYVEFHKQRGNNVKIIKAEIEDIHQEGGNLRDFVVEVGNGETRKVYVEVKTAIKKEMVGNILKKFEDVKGEKWVLARFCDSDAIKSLTDKGINVYTYDEDDKAMKMYLAIGQTGKTGKIGQTGQTE